MAAKKKLMQKPQKHKDMQGIEAKCRTGKSEYERTETEKLEQR